MREPPEEIKREIRERIRTAWAEAEVIPHAELRKRYPEWKAWVDEAVIGFVTDEMEEWPEGDPDFEAVIGEIADHAFLGEEPPSWAARRGVVDLSRFRPKG